MLPQRQDAELPVHTCLLLVKMPYSLENVRVCRTHHPHGLVVPRLESIVASDARSRPIMVVVPEAAWEHDAADDIQPSFNEVIVESTDDRVRLQLYPGSTQLAQWHKHQCSTSPDTLAGFLISPVPSGTS